MPIAPHLLFPQFLDDNCPVEREKGLAFGLALLEKADELWVFGTHQSEGMRRDRHYPFANRIFAKFPGIFCVSCNIAGKRRAYVYYFYHDHTSAFM
jgi:hypothetical protein